MPKSAFGVDSLPQEGISLNWRLWGTKSTVWMPFGIHRDPALQ